MKKIFLYTFLLLSTLIVKADWMPVATGISDNFNGVYFSYSTQNNGIIAGDHGLYYTQTGISGTWLRFNITGNSIDSALYEHSQFYKIASGQKNNSVYIIGRDTVADKAIILSFDLSTLSYAVEYTGPAGSRLNGIVVRNIQAVYAVGTNGLILRKYLAGNFTPVPNNSSADLYCVSIEGSNRVVAAGDEMHIEAYEDGTNLTLTHYNQPGRYFKSIEIVGGTIFYSVGNDFYEVVNAMGNIIAMPNYDFGPLNAKKSTPGARGTYVATDHGVFLASQDSILEYQPTSNGNSLNDIYFIKPNSYIGYTCGDNSTLLATTDGGGINKPYCRFYPGGGCKGVNLNITGKPGSGSSCKWLINNVQVSTNVIFNYSFPNTGSYQADFIVWNAAGLYDTATQVINIVDTPLVSMQVTLADTILCNAQPLNITINNTQLNMLYIFRLGPFGSPLGLGIGNGGTLTFDTDSNLTTGSYSLVAQSNIAKCSKVFPQNLNVIVEKTKSQFHFSKYNAEPGETVNFNATSVDAQNFLWSFGPNASIATSNLKKVDAVSYANLGNTVTTLVSWSANGCYDTLTANSTYIYNEPTTDDTCWAFNVDDIDPVGSNHLNNISYGLPVDDGILICGTAMQDSFKTRYGKPQPRTTGGGGYIAKYTFNGTIKWAITSIGPNYNNLATDMTYVTSVATDAAGNMYAVGNSREGIYFTDNNGNQIDLITHPQLTIGNHGFIAKFDSLGRFIWSTQLNYSVPGKIMIDHNNNLVVMCTGGTSVTYYTSTAITHLYTGSRTGFILKTDTAGALIWSTSYHTTGTSSIGSYYREEFSLDAAGNIYINGSCSGGVHQFFNAGNQTDAADSIPLQNGYGLSQGYVVKYNSSGIVQWHNLICQTSSGSAFLYTTAIVADSAGNTYVTGRANGSGSNDTLIVINPNGSQIKKKLGCYFLIKTNTNGENIWFTGNDYSVVGGGSGVFLHDDKVVASGIITGPFFNAWTGVMYSTDGNDVNFTIDNGDFFIASYDTSGAIDFVTKTGHNTVYVFSSYGNIFGDKHGNIYLTGDIMKSTNPLPLHYFDSDSIEPNGWDGFIAKMGTVPCNLTTEIHNPAIKENASCNLFPNPTTDLITIEMKNSTEEDPNLLTILNTLGQTIYSVIVRGQKIKLDLSAFTKQPGIYYLTVQGKKQRYSAKLVYLK